MSRAFYVVIDDNKVHRSQIIDLLEHPDYIENREIITYVHGLMFEEDWSPGTPHAIFITDEDNTWGNIHDTDHIVDTAEMVGVDLDPEIPSR